jgi:feruloyl esterase
VIVALAAFELVATAPLPAERCLALRNASVRGVKIELAEQLAGRFKGPDGSNLVVAPLCRVRGVARPTSRSHITFELWLPRDAWNGRYYQLGNGGFAGYIHFPSLAAEAARGNAAAITDTGHNADGFDARWAAGNPNAVTDYGYRSIKATSDAAHALITLYYGRAPARRYFAGCSIGGRQALMAAQRYPDDWDGIIAGAPANLWTSQLFTFATLQHRLRAVPGAWLPPAKLPAIQREALASCPLGTVAGGIAVDPAQCRFNAARLLCKGPEHAHCITGLQAESLRQIHAAGYQPTSAAVADNWSRWIVNPDPASPSQLTFATQAFRYLLQHSPDWQVRDFSPWFRIPHGVRRTLDADALDYDRFRARGGRIISYFGWSDAVISPQRGLDYYRRVARRTGAVRASEFYRLFMVPGMTHCQGGPGADSFGQSLAAPALLPDPAHDIRRALERWVEQGVAPDRLIAAKYAVEGRPERLLETRVLRPVR